MSAQVRTFAIKPVHTPETFPKVNYVSSAKQGSHVDKEPHTFFSDVLIGYLLNH